MSGTNRAIVTSLYQSALRSRVNKVDIGAKSLFTPCYFPALSTCVTKYTLDSLFDFLYQYSKPLLISAYDLYEEFHEKNHIKSKMEGMPENILFLDSGRFESSWFNSQDWSFERYKATIKSTTHDLYTSFDVFPEEAGEDFEQLSVERINQCIAINDSNICIPIVHIKNIDSVLSILKAITGIGIKFIALPERELGDSIFDRCNSIFKVRQFLDSSGLNVLIHILGCGHPISVLLYIYAGADSFDSLDWQKHVIDPHNYNFKDYAHMPLIKCDCKYCNNKEIPYVYQAYLHNLFLIKRILSDAAVNIKNNSFEEFLKKYTLIPSIEKSDIRN